MTIPEMRIGRKKVRAPFVVSATANTGKRRRRPTARKPAPIKEVPLEQKKIQRENDEENEDSLLKESNHPNPISDWVITIEEKINAAGPPCERGCPWAHHCIFRVPRNLLEMDPKSYIPQIVSIGPYHNGKSHLQEMESHKWRFLRHLLDRTGHHVEMYLDAMSQLEDHARHCYAGLIKEMNAREFVEMMLIDACFILELLRTSIQGIIHCGYSWGDPIFTTRGVVPCIQRDMLMIENQLPLFVLDRLFTLTAGPDETDSVAQLALQFFDSVIPGCQNENTHLFNSNDYGFHLLHLIRQSLLPSPRATFTKIRTDHQPQLMVHCVTNLRESGIKFRKKRSDKFMDIKFHNGVLEIPPLVIHDSTKSIFLNLMAFEQCYPHCSNDVTSYISFMDGLINSSQDVGYLRQQGIIDHGLGSEDDVARLFNGLCREIAFNMNDCYLSHVSDEVNKYFDRRWHVWRASLKHEYFRHPWAIISLVAAILLIGLTLAQTFYTIFPYYVPSS
ncbi:UPF0481 protein At3g47200-like [Magnolia sinica]|uniref:UPF0481 protein At3g47200-like n=1 Tax=Magnolia sinica TaxID=86752 RepID=UPI0026594EE9|nr:UPF0481 protein At3g47200-like [Magnolia sinica]